MNLSQITAALAALSIPGVDIFDIGTFPNDLDTRTNAALFPDDANFVTDLTVTRDTFGQEASAFKHYNYSLSYILAYQQVGAGRTLAELFDPMVDLAALIEDTVTDTDFATNGGIEVIPSIVSIGIVTSPAGIQYYGARFNFAVMEFLH